MKLNFSCQFQTIICLLVLFVLIALWNIYSNSAVGFWPDYYHHCKLHDLDPMVMSEQDNNTVVVVVDFQGSLENMFTWIKDSYADSFSNIYKVKFIITMEILSGKFKNIVSIVKSKLYFRIRTGYFLHQCYCTTACRNYTCKKYTHTHSRKKQ